MLPSQVGVHRTPQNYICSHHSVAHGIQFIKGIVHQLDMYTLEEAISHTDHHGVCHRLRFARGGLIFAQNARKY